MYLDLRGDLASSTKLGQERTLSFLKEHLGDEKIVNKITPLDARRFVAWYREREYRGRRPAPATVNRIVRECRRISQEAIACSIIWENPFKGIRQEKVGQKPWHQVTTVEYQRLIDAAPSLRWQAMITLGYCCGLRIGEVLNLTWSDVDFERSRIRIARKQASSTCSAWSPKDRDGA